MKLPFIISVGINQELKRGGATFSECVFAVQHEKIFPQITGKENNCNVAAKTLKRPRKVDVRYL